VGIQVSENLESQESSQKESSLVTSVSSVRNYLNVCAKIENKALSAMFDTGASVSILSSEFFQELGMSLADLQPTHTVLKSVCGDKLVIHGKTELDLQIGNKIFRNMFVIADIKFPNQMYHAILGLDFMTKSPNKEKNNQDKFRKNSLVFSKRKTRQSSSDLEQYCDSSSSIRDVSRRNNRQKIS
jgi:predicted aspartyl protease